MLHRPVQETESQSYRDRKMTPQARLKISTSDAHRAIEVHMMIDERVSSRESYITLLKKLLGFHRPLEQYMLSFDWCSYGIEFGARLKVPALTADLALLGGSKMNQRAIADMGAAALPTIKTTAQAFGCLYVLEGATFGGRIISKMIERSLAITAHNGALYYSGYGENTGAMWKQFSTAMNAVLVSEDIDNAHHAAVATFSALGAWVSRE
jgi:heme oxygenase (biliverdin-IX-beta and delta-forming)